MAKLKRGIRSQAVRDYLAKNPTAGVKAVIEGLAKEGMKVSSGLVNVIKYKKAKRKRVQAAADSSKLDIKHLIAVKRVVNELGGIAQVKSALAALEKLL